MSFRHPPIAKKEKYFAPVFSTTPTPLRPASRRTPAILKSE
jgi:hypothetical protein